MSSYNSERFIEPSNRIFDIALAEIKRSKKQSHWMWFIFPQLKGLGKTSTSDYYGIVNLEEARAHLEYPILGVRLLEITKVLLNIKGKTAFQIFGTPDYLKLKSCMTLFHLADNKYTIFEDVLDKYYMGFEDGLTKIKLDV